MWICLVIKVLPVTSDRWADLEDLFGPKGAYWGCWCMYWRLTNKEFNGSVAADHRIKLKIIVEENKIPGLLAYSDDEPVGWMSISPKESYARLVKSRVIPKVDDQKVLSIVCFFIKKDFHGQGITKKLIEAADDFAESQGYQIIEAYPVKTDGTQISPEGAYVGIFDVFANLGYHFVSGTNSKSAKLPRVIVRKEIEST